MAYGILRCNQNVLHSVLAARARSGSTLAQAARLFGLAIALAPAAIGSTSARAADVSTSLPTVASVDLQRYLGRWYEIARLPNRFERKCASDVEADYRVEPGGIHVLNRCRTTDGQLYEANGHAKVVAGSNNAKLRVSFFWPFYGDYWVLALDPDYSAVLVGEPSREFAWVLARRPDLPEARLTELLARALALGFDAGAFQKTSQLKPLDAPAPSEPMSDHVGATRPAPTAP